MGDRPGFFVGDGIDRHLVRALFGGYFHAGKRGAIMTAAQFKACVEVARNGAIDLSAYDESALFGFGLPDFKPVLVPLGAVARCIRWQCCQFNGGFDWEQLNEDKPHYLRNVELCDWYTARETEAWKADLVRVLVAGPVGMLETEVSK